MDIRRGAVFGKAPPDDAFAIGGEERPAIVARRVRQPPLIRAVGVHDVDFAEVGGIDLKTSAIFSA